MDKEDLHCKDLQDSINNLNDQWKDALERLSDLERTGEELSRRKSELERARDDLVSSGGLLSGLGRLGPLGLGLTAADAISKANALSKIDAEIGDIERQRERLVRKLSDLERRKRELELLIRQTQRDFFRTDCFRRGFGHDVMNMLRF